MPGRAATAATASLLLLAAAFVLVASQRERHQLGSNLVKPVAFVATSRPGVPVCQRVAVIPAGTGAIGIRIGTFGRPGPELTTTLLSRGAPPLRGTLAAGWTQGDVAVPIPELAAERRDVRVCVEHRGAGEIAFAGGGGGGEGVRVGRRSGAGVLRVEYLEPQARSWWPVIGRIGNRIAIVRDALPGTATLPLYAILMLAVLGGSMLVVLREGRR